MAKDAIFERITVIIRDQMDQPDLEVTKTMSLQDDLGVDSIGLTEFIISLEDEFDIEIPDEDVENMTYMSDLSDYIEARLAQK